MKNRKRISVIAIIVSLIIIVPLILQLQSASAQVIDPKTLVPPTGYFSTQGLPYVNMPVNKAGFKVSKIVVTGPPSSGAITLDTATETVKWSGINGTPTPVSYTENKHPFLHVIWRNSAGDKWNTQDTGHKYEFSGGCISGGVSDCPGPFPSVAYDVTSGTNASMPTFASTGGSGGALYEPSNNGGVADDHSIVPDANSFKDASGTIVPSSAISGIDLDPVATKCSDILTQPTCQVIQSGTINSKQFVAVSMVFNNQVYQTGSPFGYSIIGNVAMGTPGLVGNAEGRKYFMAVDIAWKGITYKYTGPFPTIDVYYDPVTSPTSTPTPTPPIVITGDFTVNPSAIKFRDSFTLHPLPFSIPAGCTYKYHQYRFSASGYFWDSPLVTSRTADSVFSYANYPTNLAVGSNTIYINVVADCASTNFITSHNLDVSAPINDRPPVFDIGWFHQGDAQGYVPIYQAVLNDYLNLRVIHDNTVTPKTPYDPDGDSIYYTWQFDASNSTWVKGLPSNYGLDVHNEAFQNLKATKLGSHTVKAVAADQFGASSSRTATIDVVMPNPVPIVSCPALVKEYRPLGATDINADKSYSPRGSAIDHTRDEWTNKLGSYYNGTLSNISTTVTLNRVYDNTGLVSDYTNPETGAFVSQASSCSITVTPDFPPVGKLQVPPLGIRGQNVTIKNLSYSPDNDQIVSVKWRYKYDSNNNGFSDDPWVNISAMDVKVSNFL